MPHNSSRGPSAPRRQPASVERLGARVVPASTFQALPTSVFYLADVYSQFTSDLTQIELNSRATPAEFLALRDDARAISAATASTALSLQAAADTASTVTLQLGRAPLDGWLGPNDWSAVESRLGASLQSLGASQALIAKTIGDMQAIAASARVSLAEYNTFTNDFNQLRTDESQPGAGSYDYPDPQLYYAQHLLGFFRGSTLRRSADMTQLKTDLRALPTASGADPSGRATVQRDAQILQKLGATLPSGTSAQFLSTYQSAFAQGAPTLQQESLLKSSLLSVLGAAATPAQTASVNRLVADAPAFFRALGSSPSNVLTIDDDVQAVLNDGVGSTPDPFRIMLAPGAGG